MVLTEAIGPDVIQRVQPMLAPGGCRTPMVIGTHFSKGFALIGTETASWIPQRDAVDHLGCGGNAKQLMQPLFHHGMQGGDGAANAQGTGRQQ